jgi:hypothetical protein
MWQQKSRAQGLKGGVGDTAWVLWGGLGVSTAVCKVLVAVLKLGMVLWWPLLAALTAMTWHIVNV